MIPESARTQFQIRIAQPSDADSIAAVANAAFAIETFLEGDRTNSEHVLNMMRRGQFLVAEKGDGVVVGSVFLELRGERGYFGMLSVSPARQAAGIGHALIRAIEDYCREQGCSAMDITVLSLRPELLPFYRKLGYRETGKEEFRPHRPLKPGVECHAIVLSKEL